MIRSAIIGVGDVSFVHIEAIKRIEGVALVAACDLAEEAKAKLPNDVHFYTDWEEMLEKEDIDVVHLCLPHYLHYAMAQAVLAKGVHIFTEKPLAINLAEAEAFADLEKEYRAKGQKVGLCLQNRFNRTIVELKKRLEHGDFGKICSVKGNVRWCRTQEYYRAKPWRGTWDLAGGGVMLNQSIHTLDLMTYLAGEVDQISATVSGLADYEIEVEDTVSALLRFKSGAVGNFFATFTNHFNEPVYIRVDCEQGTYEIFEDCLYVISADGSKETVCENDCLSGSKSYYGAGHLFAIQAFYKAITDDTENYIHAADGVYVIRLIDSIQISELDRVMVQVDQVRSFSPEQGKQLELRKNR